MLSRKHNISLGIGHMTHHHDRLSGTSVMTWCVLHARLLQTPGWHRCFRTTGRVYGITADTTEEDVLRACTLPTSCFCGIRNYQYYFRRLGQVSLCFPRHYDSISVPRVLPLGYRSVMKFLTSQCESISSSDDTGQRYLNLPAVMLY